MTSLDEAATWRKAVAGDGDAFGLLFDAHQHRVYRHALRMLRDRHDAEDVLAATFLELWRRRDAVRPVDGSVLPWLLVTAGNLSLNQARGCGDIERSCNGCHAPRNSRPQQRRRRWRRSASTWIRPCWPRSRR